MSEFNENVVEFISGHKKLSFTFSSRRFINRIKKYKEKYPDDVDLIENSDGSIFGHLPITWIKISPPRKVNLTDEQRRERAERLRNARNNK